MTTVGSNKQARGIGVGIFDPLVWSADRRGFHKKYEHLLSGWDMELGATGGFLQASLNIPVGAKEINRWITRGLGRHVEARNPAGIEVFSGFVNRGTITTGPLTIEFGPLVDIANRAAVSYAFQSTATNPPITGVQLTTALDDNLESQGKYGIWEKVYNSSKPASNNATNDAERLRDTILATEAWPKTTKNFQSPSAGTLSVDILGYYHWLWAYLYIYTTDALSVTIEDKIETVLAADPNGILSTEYGWIDDNGWLVTGYENDNRYAGDVISAHVALGDVNDVPWTFGIYGDRIAHYHAMTAAITYQSREVLGDRIETFSPLGGQVDPWDVKPGRWLFFADFLPGTPPPTTIQGLMEDLRCEWIETVQFTAPDGLAVNGFPVSTLRQMLAKHGLG